MEFETDRLNCWICDLHLKYLLTGAFSFVLVETSLLTVVTSPIIFLALVKLRPRSLKGFNFQSIWQHHALSITVSGFLQSVGTSAWLEEEKQFPPDNARMLWWQLSGGWMIKRGGWAGRCGCVWSEDVVGSTDAPGICTSKGLQLLPFPCRALSVHFLQ